MGNCKKIQGVWGKVTSGKYHYFPHRLIGQYDKGTICGKRIKRDKLHIALDHTDEGKDCKMCRKRYLEGYNKCPSLLK